MLAYVEVRALLSCSGLYPSASGGSRAAVGCTHSISGGFEEQVDFASTAPGPLAQAVRQDAGMVRSPCGLWIMLMDLKNGNRVTEIVNVSESRHGASKIVEATMCLKV